MELLKGNKLFHEQIDGLPDEAKRQFCRMYAAFLEGDTGKFFWDDIDPLSAHEVVERASLSSDDIELGESLMGQVAFLKLNGGLGMSMGCEGPKSLVPLSEKTTFLSLICDQIRYLRKRWQKSIPFVLMNSFSTDRKTREFLSDSIDFLAFQQHQFPRILAATKGPFLPQDSQQAWNPPGHGDVYWSLLTSGVLDTLLSRGITYVFISNSDNLGPDLDPGILGYMHRHELDFLMEMTPKTQMDIKGGTVVRYRNRLALLERSQLEEAHLKDFEDVSQFPYFNTNNIWVRLDSLKKLLLSGDLQLPLILNSKMCEGEAIIQLESAMGAAIGCFEKSAVMVVPRDRFLPVKHTSDLLVVQSDLIMRHENGFLSFAEDSVEKAYPLVKLGSDFYSVKQYLAHVLAAPSLKGLKSLVIEGDVVIGEGVSFSGNVVIRVPKGETLKLDHVCVDSSTVLNSVHSAN
ncbi:MAG: UTP--glucose-1-phosphate uridylyltransferase [Candidatus Margulisbacteria bacterium]|nr:UTP--glucose-1-phosphate uridylyltransferase [Candidatus Margulisiibacteriota bacterium]